MSEVGDPNVSGNFTSAITDVHNVCLQHHLQSQIILRASCCPKLVVSRCLAATAGPTFSAPDLLLPSSMHARLAAAREMAVFDRRRHFVDHRKQLSFSVNQQRKPLI